MKKTNGSKITILCILAALTVLCAFVLTGCVQKGYKLTYNLDGAVYSESTVKPAPTSSGLFPKYVTATFSTAGKTFQKLCPKTTLPFTARLLSKTRSS